MQEIRTITSLRATAARRCVRVIKHYNDGTWPESLCEWRRVCRRVDLHLVLVRSVHSFRAATQDDAVILAFNPCDKRMYNWLAHEVAEWLTTWDGAGPPMVAPGVDRHDVARLAEDGGAF